MSGGDRSSAEASVPAVWREDGALLARIGEVLADQETWVEVRVPRALADAAVEAWQREADEPGAVDEETSEERLVRQRAAAFALIGESIEVGGREDGDDVIVRLHAWFVGDALNAADDHGLLT